MVLRPTQFLTRVLIPLSWNIIAALFVIQFVYTWNMFLWPSLIIRDDSRQVVQVAIQTLQNIDGLLDLWAANARGDHRVDPARDRVRADAETVHERIRGRTRQVGNRTVLGGDAQQRSFEFAHGEGSH